MKRVLAVLCALICAFGLLPKAAVADDLYLIPDSNTRLLTKEELHKWDRESLSFIFNELFARYGYVFNAGGKYDNWFRAMPWYKPNADPDNGRAVMPKVTDLEWKNYYLIKEVIAEKEAAGETGHDASRKCYRKLTPPGKWSLTGFSYVDMKTGQKIPIYSAPSEASWRGADGKAMVSTNGAVWAAGWENGWLLMYYETNNGSIRVGYGSSASMTSRPDINVQLQFSYIQARILQGCSVTDDPLKTATSIRMLDPGDTVTYLTTVMNQSGMVWDYIETTVNGKAARGYIPSGCADVYEPEEDLSMYYGNQ